MRLSTKRLVPLSLGAAAVVVGGLTGPASPASAAGTVPIAPTPLVAKSTSWPSAETGWVLGFRACGDEKCMKLARTGDGGESWVSRTPPPLHRPSRDEVRIVVAPDDPAAGANGSSDATTVAYVTDGRRVFVSRDGARTWRKIHLVDVDGHASVGDLVATATRVYAIVGEGGIDNGRTRLFAAETTEPRWRAVTGVETAGNGVNVDGGWDLVTDGRAVAVALGRIFLDNGYWTSRNGRDFTAQDAPCTDDQVPDLGAARRDDVAALCSYNPGTGHMFKDLLISHDGGEFEPDGSAPDLGITQQYVSPSPGEHVITAIGGASILYRSAGDEWEDPLFLPDALPWADLQFPDADHGFVVWGGPRYGQGAVYRSTDGGHSWTTLDLP